MLHAKDLMIGDYLGCDASPWVKVTAIAEDGIYFEDEISGGACSFDHLFGLPLTPEILEKNGFKNMGYYGRCEVGDWKILCDTRNVAINLKEHTDIDIPIEYVHQLQHALRLCGIEKEIEL